MHTNITSQDYTVRAAATQLSVSVHAVYALINTGSLESYKLSARSTRITQAQLDRFRNTGGAR